MSETQFGRSGICLYPHAPHDSLHGGGAALVPTTWVLPGELPWCPDDSPRAVREGPGQALTLIEAQG